VPGLLVSIDDGASRIACTPPPLMPIY